MAKKLIKLRYELVFSPVGIRGYRKIPVSPNTEPFYGKTLEPRENLYGPAVEAPVHRDRNASIQVHDLTRESLGYIADTDKCRAFPLQVLLKRVSIHGLLLCGLFVPQFFQERDHFDRFLESVACVLCIAVSTPLVSKVL